MFIYCIFQIITTRNICEYKLKDLSYEPLDNESVLDKFLLVENSDVSIEYINAAPYVDLQRCIPRYQSMNAEC